MNFKSIIYTFAWLSLSLLVACNNGNNIPQVGNVIIAPATSVCAGAISTITAVITDADGDPMTYFWQANRGEVPAGSRTASISYTAPLLAGDGQDLITLTVSDGKSTIIEKITIAVVDCDNELPVVDTIIVEGSTQTPNPTPSVTPESTLPSIIQTPAPTVAPEQPERSNGEQNTGNLIVFTSDRDGNKEIYVVDINDSANPTRLTFSDRTDANPEWSPDGSKIAFESSRDGNFEIYVMNADGSNQQPVTADPGFDLAPVWSPDGNKIAFQSSRSGSYQIHVVDLRTQELLKITDSGLQSFAPTWSPDGTEIAYFEDQGDGNRIIKASSVDNPEQIRIIVEYGWDPSWSPDGRTLVYSSTYHGDKDIAFINSSGSGTPEIWRRSSVDEEPTWSPDGQWIAFASDRAGKNNQNDIYIIQHNQSGIRNLTGNSGANNEQPSWQPAP